MKDTISLVLGHLSVNVETAEAKLSDALSKKLYTLNRVAKDDTLVNVKFFEESI